MAERTPTPWTLRYRAILDEDGHLIAAGSVPDDGTEMTADYDLAAANAAFIVNACNAYEANEAKIEALVTALQALDLLIDFSDDNVENVWTFEDTSAVEEAFRLAREALALTSAERE